MQVQALQYLLMVIFMFFTMASVASQDKELAQSILEKADQIRFPRESFQVDVNINTTAPDKPDDRRKYQVLSKGNENSIVMTTEPASERGQILLMKGRDLWIFLPNVSQPVRIGLAQGRRLLLAQALARGRPPGQRSQSGGQQCGRGDGGELLGDGGGLLVGQVGEQIQVLRHPLAGDVVSGVHSA